MKKMQNEKDKIKELARSAFSGFEAEPPENMWSRIEQAKQRKRILPYWLIGMAASIALLLGIGLAVLNPFGEDNAITLKTPETASRESSAQPVSKTQSHGISTPQPAVSSERSSHQAALTPVNPGKVAGKPGNPVMALSGLPAYQTTTYQQPLEESIAGNTPGQPAKPAGSVDSLPASAVLTDPQVSLVVQSGIKKAPETEDQPEKPGPSSTADWQLAMNYTTSVGKESSGGDLLMSASQSQFSNDGFTSGIAEETAYFENIATTTHDVPLSLGFMLSRQLHRRWYFETGLLYTRLGYTMRTTQLSDSYQRSSSHLASLVLPLGIRFNLLEYKKISLFATQSAIIEKGTGIRSSTETYQSGQLTSTSDERTGIRGVQLSSLTGFGAGVKAGGNFSVYGQAGLQLFLLNRTQPFNIRSAHVAWPSFQIGVRMELR